MGKSSSTKFSLLSWRSSSNECHDNSGEDETRTSPARTGVAKNRNDSDNTASRVITVDLGSADGVNIAIASAGTSAHAVAGADGVEDDDERNDCLWSCVSGLIVGTIAGVLMLLAFVVLNDVYPDAGFRKISSVTSLFAAEAGTLGLIKTIWTWCSVHPKTSTKAWVESVLAALAAVSALVAMLSPFTGWFSA